MIDPIDDISMALAGLERWISHLEASIAEAECRATADEARALASAGERIRALRSATQAVMEPINTLTRASQDTHT